MNNKHEYYIRTIYTGVNSSTSQLVDRDIDYPVAGYSEDHKDHSFVLAYSTKSGRLKSQTFESFDKMMAFVHRNYENMRYSYDYSSIGWYPKF